MFSNWNQIVSSASSFFKRIIPTLLNPLCTARITLIVPLYASLTTRIFKRFWVYYGFKAIFMVVFFFYASNVWSESLSDDPFTIVGVSTSASPSAVRRACRQGSLKLHPDKHPGKEEQIRPLFEKHTRACKILNNKDLRAKYVKWGTLPKSDQKTGGAEIETPSMIKVGGGGGMLTYGIYFLVLVALPCTVLYHVGDFISDSESLLKKIAADCKSLNNNMNALYTYDRFSSTFLDVAELYLLTAQAELKCNKIKAQEILSANDNASRGSILNSLEGFHASRFDKWLNFEKKDSPAVLKVNDKIQQASEAIDNLTKARRGSSKGK